MAIKQMTREEYEKQYGVKPRVSSVREKPEQGGNFLTGLAKSELSTAKGLLTIGEKLGGKAIIKGVDKITGQESIPLPSEQKFFSDEALKTRGTGERVGKFVGDVAQFAIPGAVATKATKALSLVPRIAARAGVSGAVGVAQTGELKGGAIAAGAEALAPGVSRVAGAIAKPVTTFAGRLLRGVGSGLSGASSAQIKAILENPKAAKQFVGAIKKAGGASLLREEAETIVQGVSGIKKEARKAFGEGLEQLSEVDIKPSVFRENISGVLNNFGSVVKGGQRILQNVEFDDPKHLKKASGLINKLSKVELNGKSLRKLADDIASSKYKIATSDERLAFNAFINELSAGLKSSITKSTDKLDDINRAFSQDMQLAEEIEKIFGKVKFKNAREILGVSQKLENLFGQKGLAPESVDKFLTKLGIKPTEFRAGEAARQMGELAERANTIGTNPFEIIRAFTAAVVPPQAVRSLAIVTGISREVLQKIATKLSPTARAVFVRTILGERTGEEEESPK